MPGHRKVAAPRGVDSVRCGGAGGDGGGLADGVAVDDEFDAAIALAALGGVVGGNGLRFAEAAGGHGAGGDALFGEEVADGIGAAFGELLIEVVGADAVGVTFDLECEAAVGEENSGNFGQLFARAGFERGTPRVEEHVRHIDDEATGGVTSLQNGIELFQELRAQLGFFVFGLRGGLQSFLGLSFGGVLLVESCLTSLLGFGLLFGGFERGLFRFGFLPGGFLSGLLGFEFHALGFGLGLLGLKAGLLGFLTATGFRFGFAVFSGFFLRGEAGLRFLFSLLLDGHYANFFGGFDDIASGRLHHLFVALGVIGVFRGGQLLFGLGQRGSRVLAATGVARDANGIACFEEFARGLGVDAENGVFDFGVGGRVDAAAEEFVGGVDVFDFAAASDGNRVFEDDHVSGLGDGEIGLGGDDHGEGLHVGDGLDLSGAIFGDDFAEIFGAALSGDGPEDVGEIFEAELRGVVQAFKFRFDLHAVLLAFDLYFGAGALQEFGALEIDFCGTIGAAIVHGLGGARDVARGSRRGSRGVRLIDRGRLRKGLTCRGPKED